MLALVVATPILVYALVLAEAHLEMQRLEPEIPSREVLLGLLDVKDGPVRLSYVDTATQSPIGHPAYLFEWADGRILSVDVGMEPEGAAAFGATMEALLGADPIAIHGSLSKQMGEHSRAISAVAFTHLHLDHTGGLPGLCEGRTDRISVFQTPRQSERGNFRTRPGRNDLDRTQCADFRALERAVSGTPFTIPGYAGVVAIQVSGHTPGSTVFAANVAGKRWLIGGDVTNSMDDLRADAPKPFVYSAFIVPEARGHLAALRYWLAALDHDPDFEVLVSHDHDEFTARVAAWRPADPPR